MLYARGIWFHLNIKAFKQMQNEDLLEKCFGWSKELNIFYLEGFLAITVWTPQSTPIPIIDVFL
jgi:hypothetical protein